MGKIYAQKNGSLNDADRLEIARLLCHYCDGRNICSYDEEKAHELLRNEEGDKND